MLKEVKVGGKEVLVNVVHHTNLDWS